MNLPKQINTAIELLSNKGFEAFLVGGCVRDNLLGCKQKDFDITTNASPYEVIEVFFNYKVIKTGLKHGTVTVVIDSLPIEITTYRVDGEYLDNRHPESVTFTKNLKDDLARRDFTINSICYNPKLGFVDYLGGKEDLKNKIIRAVGKPQKRFKEDALRILRAIRFSAILGFKIELNTKEAIFSQKELLKNISMERIASEFVKIISAPFSKKILKEYYKVIAVFIPEIIPTVGFSQHTKYHCYDVFEHCITATKSIGNTKVLKLAAFFHDIGKPQTFTLDEKGNGHFFGHAQQSVIITNNILSRLKFDNDTINRVLLLIKYHDTPIELNEKAVKRWLNRLTLSAFEELLELKKHDCLAQSKEYQYCINEIEQIKALAKKILDERACFLLKDLCINGNDLIDIGFLQSKEIGILLNELLELVIDERLQNERNELLNYVRNKRRL